MSIKFMYNANNGRVKQVETKIEKSCCEKSFLFNISAESQSCNNCFRCKHILQ